MWFGGMSRKRQTLAKVSEAKTVGEKFEYVGSHKTREMDTKFF